VRAATMISDALLAQRGHLIGWVPLFLACGIGWYFAIRVEPSWPFVMAVLVFSLMCMLGARAVHVSCTPVLLALALVGAGVGLAKWRTESVGAPVLTFRYYGPIEGRVVGMDRSGSDALRLTLDQVFLNRLSPDRTPERVRISLHGEMPFVDVQPGQVIMTTGHLSPPSGPAEPGGFDFQRHAWFAGIGAVGYTRNPLLRLAPAQNDGWALRVFQARMAVSGAVQSGLSGEVGAFAAAIMSGDRSGMSQVTLANLRASNLAHLLAISGLHMGLLTGFVFAVLRGAMVLIPSVGLRWPVKKIAAFGALLAAGGYLALSGGNVATERAFTMVAVMLVAIMLGRPALTLRAVAMAAIVILVLQPESFTGPGFQMSFAATTALVFVFKYLRHANWQHWPRWTRGAVSLVISSFVAALATAPFAAAHFNQIAHYGLIANLLSVPLMGVLVMPAAVVAACLAPLGLAWVGLAVMGWGLRWILLVAETVASQDGALGHVVAPQWYVLPVLAGGALWLVLWQGRARMAGIVVVGVAFLLWSGATRPDILVADSGGMIGRMTPNGRALSKPRGDGFVTGVWLENDGAPVNQEIAGVRDGVRRGTRRYGAVLGGWDILQVSGKMALAEIQGCDGADILISNQSNEVQRPCEVFDIERLRETGALGLSLTEFGGLKFTAAQTITGNRPWSAQSDGDPVALSFILHANNRQFANVDQ
jgi:competence protein ComEC